MSIIASSFNYLYHLYETLGLKIEGANRHDMKLTRPTIESLIIEREDAHQGASLKQFLSIDGQS